MADPQTLGAVLDACAAGEIPPNVALTRLITLAQTAAEIDEALQRHAGTTGAVEEARCLWGRTPAAFRIVSAIHHLGQKPFEGQGCWPAVFDTAAALNPHAAVALYSLGDPDLLDRATKEVVARLLEWSVLDRNSAVLDFGCGTGRVTAAIAPLVRDVVAIDVSQEMVDLARAANAVHTNVKVKRGDDLSRVTLQFDAVLAVDSMPYVVQSGCAERLWEQIARSLVAGGAWVILNYSYRGDFEADRREISDLAVQNGFAIERNGSADFRLWDARTFLLRRIGVF